MHFDTGKNTGSNLRDLTNSSAVSSAISIPSLAPLSYGQAFMFFNYTKVKICFNYASHSLVESLIPINRYSRETSPVCQRHGLLQIFEPPRQGVSGP